MFGFGTALGALAGGLSSVRDGVGSDGRGGAGGVSGGAAGPGTGAEGGKGLGFGRYDERHVLQMIAHSSIDVVEDLQFGNGAM